MSDNIKLMIYEGLLKATDLVKRGIEAFDWQVEIRRQRITLPRLLNEIEPMPDEEWEAFAEGAGFDPWT